MTLVGSANIPFHEHPLTALFVDLWDHEHGTPVRRETALDPSFSRNVQFSKQVWNWWFPVRWLLWKTWINSAIGCSRSEARLRQFFLRPHVRPTFQNRQSTNTFLHTYLLYLLRVHSTIFCRSWHRHPLNNFARYPRSNIRRSIFARTWT